MTQKLKHNANGFHIVPVLVFLVVVGIVGLVGWRVMNSKDTPQPTTVQPNQEQPQSKLSGNYLGDITSKLELEQVKLTEKGQQGIAIDDQTGLVYVGTYSGINNKCLPGNLTGGKSYLSVIDPATAKETAAVVTDGAPIWPSVDSDRGEVYVAASSGTVAIHKTGSGEKLGSIAVGGLPHMPAHLDNILVVSNTNDQSQTYYSAVNLDTKKIIGDYASPKFPHPIAIDTEAKLAYMMGVEAAEVVVIDMSTGKPGETFKLEGGGGQMTLSKKLGKFITSSSKPGTSMAVFDFDSKKSVGTIGFEGVNAPGSGVAIDEQNGLAFVVISDQNAVGVASLETLKPLGFIKTGGCPYAVKIDANRGKGYVTNSGDGTLTIFDIKNLLEALK